MTTSHPTPSDSLKLTSPDVFGNPQQIMIVPSTL